MNGFFNGLVYGLAFYAVLDIIISIILYRKNPNLLIEVSRTFQSIFTKKSVQPHTSWDECCGDCDCENCDGEACDHEDCYLCKDND